MLLMESNIQKILRILALTKPLTTVTGGPVYIVWGNKNQTSLEGVKLFFASEDVFTKITFKMGTFCTKWYPKRR